MLSWSDAGGVRGGRPGRSPSAYSSPTPRRTPPGLFWCARVSRGSRSRAIGPVVRHGAAESDKQESD
jgi:hypothetical protein